MGWEGPEHCGTWQMFCKRSHAVLLNHPDLVVRMEMQSELIWGGKEGGILKIWLCTRRFVMQIYTFKTCA